MTTQSRVTEEPFLAVRTGSRPARSTATRVAAAILSLLALAGVWTLTVSGNLSLLESIVNSQRLAYRRGPADRG